ncbi:RNase adapter RapZ [Microbispora amethystogenes]|uniref:RapZ C-terminal domain-containing protein n=1 Tax=Microbispora amethystogenes TaxID=1427754 RepID=UPI0033FD117B
MGPVHVTSFGYGHAPAPEADLTVDARRHLRNPHADPGMRELTGLDPAVRKHVLTTPGATTTVYAAATFARELAGTTRSPVTVAVGCVGGRHRSVALAEQIATTLRERGVTATVTHRDVHRPVIQK